MSSAFVFDKLFIFDLANNHGGSVEHGICIIREIAQVCKKYNFRFGFKLQYRHLDSFIHPDFKGSKEFKYVKRFEETRLSEEELKILKDEIVKLGFISICTPFDEKSVDLLERHKFDIIKIGSCSFTDWPLLERIIQTDLPIIASIAGASWDEIDRVVTFFEHRNKNFCLMHCVGEYPTKEENLQLNQISLLRQRYAGIPVGFSTHEDPNNTDAIKIAIAQGAKVFERHVDVEYSGHKINAYSSIPQQIDRWLSSAELAFKMLGTKVGRYPITEKEAEDLRGLKRGVFAKSSLKKGQRLALNNVFFAIPSQKNQILANDMSKYIEYTLTEDIEVNKAITFDVVTVKDQREKILKIIKDLKNIILTSRIALPEKIELELSHHYGLDRFEEYGASIFNCVNREYCKKLIILLPGQKHPIHHHLKKEETFQVLFGSMTVKVGNERRLLKSGDILTIERGINHDFSSQEGVIFEEISTTHYMDDSFYQDEEISKNSYRKTELTFRSAWLTEDIK